MSNGMEAREVQRQHLTEKQYQTLLKKLAAEAREGGGKKFEILTAKTTIVLLPEEGKWINLTETRTPKTREFRLNEEELAKDVTSVVVNTVFGVHFFDDDYEWPDNIFEGRAVAYSTKDQGFECEHCGKINYYAIPDPRGLRGEEAGVTSRKGHEE